MHTSRDSTRSSLPSPHHAVPVQAALEPLLPLEAVLRAMAPRASSSDSKSGNFQVVLAEKKDKCGLHSTKQRVRATHKQRTHHQIAAAGIRPETLSIRLDTSRKGPPIE